MWATSIVIFCCFLLSTEVIGESCTVLPTENECAILYNATVFRTDARERANTNVKFDLYSVSLFPKCNPDPYTAITFVCLTLYPQCNNGIVVPNRKPCADFCNRVWDECSLISELGGTAPFNCSEYSEDNEEGCISIESDGQALVEKLREGAVTMTPPTVDAVDNCTASKLSEGYFTPGERILSIVWIAVWCSVCMISTTLTILTFCLDRSRFQYPWRPIVYLAICFLVLSVSYLVSLAIPPGPIIRPLQNNYIVPTKEEWQWAHTPCIISFIFLYYTQMASAMWWIVLTLCWFLAASLKWGNEAIARLAPFYHILAWSVPLILTICLMAAKVIGGDDLTGTCFVVRDHKEESFYGLLLGYILPLCVIVAVGVTLMIIGFFGIIRARNYFKEGGEETGSLDKLMIRMGVFNIIYIIPALILIAFAIYELVDQPYWCPRESGSQHCSNCHIANAGVFITRIFFSLIVGILSGVWIWSRKTLNSWKSAFEKCCQPRKGETALDKESSITATDETGGQQALSSTHVLSYNHATGNVDMKV